MFSKWIRVSALMSLAFTLACPASAFAAGATRVVSRTVSTITAGEVAGQLAGQIRAVELDSRGATITMDVNGAAAPVRVGFAGLLEGAGTGEGGSLVTLAAIPMAGGALIKLLAFLAKLGRG